MNHRSVREDRGNGPADALLLFRPEGAAPAVPFGKNRGSSSANLANPECNSDRRSALPTTLIAMAPVNHGGLSLPESLVFTKACDGNSPGMIEGPMDCALNNNTRATSLKAVPME